MLDTTMNSDVLLADAAVAPPMSGKVLKFASSTTPTSTLIDGAQFLGRYLTLKVNGAVLDWNTSSEAVTVSTLATDGPTATVSLGDTESYAFISEPVPFYLNHVSSTDAVVTLWVSDARNV